AVDHHRDASYNRLLISVVAAGPEEFPFPQALRCSMPGLAAWLRFAGVDQTHFCNSCRAYSKTKNGYTFPRARLNAKEGLCRAFRQVVQNAIRKKSNAARLRPLGLFWLRSALIDI